mgnify:CR=1 FL=1
MRGLNRSIAALLALLLILCIAVPEMADAAMLRQGSSGEQVKTLQSKLKRWGYYNGNVDGIFGSGTAQAVKYFQKKNGGWHSRGGHGKGIGPVPDGQLWRWVVKLRWVEQFRGQGPVSSGQAGTRGVQG